MHLVHGTADLFEIPEDITLLGADRDRIWGLAESAFGVQQVRVMATP
jgi:hypothetical protein